MLLFLKKKVKCLETKMNVDYVFVKKIQVLVNQIFLNYYYRNYLFSSCKRFLRSLRSVGMMASANKKLAATRVAYENTATVCRKLL